MHQVLSYQLYTEQRSVAPPKINSILFLVAINCYSCSEFPNSQ